MVKVSPRRHWAFSLLAAASLLGPGARADELVVGAGQTYTTIQSAIDVAVDGTDVVKVLPGTYNEAVDFKGKKIRVYANGGPSQTTISAAGIAKSAVVSFKTGETPDSVLEGFTLSGGTGAPLNQQAILLGGGGIFIDKSAPTIRGCVIKGNSATKGGGIYVQGVGAGGVIESCEITENQARATTGPAGGGVAIQLSGNNPDVITLKDCNISNNSATVTGAVQGGGAYIGGLNLKGKAVLANCNVTDNLVGTQAASGGQGGGLFLDTILIEQTGGEVSNNRSLSGAGITVRNLSQASFIKDVKVKGNTTLAAGGGGGLYFPANTNSRLTLTNVEISDNSCGTAGGGGMWIEASSPALESCKFINNTSGDDGGAIRAVPTGAKTKINATLFLGNKTSAGGQGGAIYASSSSAAQVIYSNCIFSKNTSTADGSAVYSNAPPAAAMKFFHCVFHANSTTLGSASTINFGANGPSASFTNCIFWDNRPTDYPAANSAQISYSVVGNPPTIVRPGMVKDDPLFVNPAADPSDFHLKDASPCVDKGLVLTDADGRLIASDLEGKPRLADGPDEDQTEAPDMGAYEIVLGPIVRPKFIRGFCRHPQASVDGARLDIGDPIYLLRWKFGGLYPEPGCVKSCDADDDGKVELNDAIYILSYLFMANRPAPKDPFATLDIDPTPDGLSCATGKID